MFKEKTVNVNRKENKKPMNKKTDKRKYTYIPKNKDEDIVAKPY